VALAEPTAPADDLVEAGVADFALSYPLSRAELYEIGAWLAAGRPTRAVSRPARAEAFPAYPTARVLVADDSAVNLEVAQGALGRFAITPTTVVNGREAVAAAAGEWDMILMDGSMPELDGFDAAREARDRRRRTPIVALTAYVVGAAAGLWRKADMDGVLHKSFTLSQLAAVLAAHLGPGAAPVSAPQADKVSPPKLLNAAALDGLAEMSGDPALVARVARLYCATAPERLAELQAAVERGDAKAQASAAHALKRLRALASETIAQVGARVA
jgi:two-component system sensor histidine kinase BarA